jgi:hypothetical protein
MVQHYTRSVTFNDSLKFYRAPLSAVCQVFEGAKIQLWCGFIFVERESRRERKTAFLEGHIALSSVTQIARWVAKVVQLSSEK